VTAPPIRVAPDGDLAALARWVSVLERMVQRAPEQWFNFYDVWSAGPAV
jgi:predicted LPLAT superfamily acyltransferase